MNTHFPKLKRTNCYFKSFEAFQSGPENGQGHLTFKIKLFESMTELGESKTLTCDTEIAVKAYELTDPKNPDPESDKLLMEATVKIKETLDFQHVELENLVVANAYAMRLTHLHLIQGLKILLSDTPYADIPLSDIEELKMEAPSEIAND